MNTSSLTKVIITGILIVLGLNIQAQNADSLVKWTSQLDKEQNAILITADIAPGWFIYSQFTEEGGPIPTEFEFSQSTGFSVEGKVEELSTATKGYDEMFEINVSKFKNTVEFKQKIKPTEGPINAKGTVTFMSCDAERCLPPVTVELDIK